MDELIKIIAKYFIVIPILVNVFILWRLPKNQKKKFLLTMLLGGLLALLFAKIGSHFYTNPRPPFKDHATPLFSPSDYNGFPSDHTLLAAFLSLCALRYSKNYAFGLMAIALIIGWSRVAAHVHHAIDIAGSLVFAAIAFTIVKLVVERFGQKT